MIWPARLVALQFPQWADLPVTDVAHSGWDNRTFRLGDDLTIRLPRSRFYAEQVGKEQRWLPLLAPNLPMPIPRPVAQGSPGLATPTPGRSTPGSTEIRRPLIGSTTRSPSPVRWRSSWWPCGRATPPTARCPGSTTGGGAARWTTTSRRPGRRWPRWPTRSTRPAATAILDAAVASTWPGPPVWFHGDIAFGNLLVRDGRLAAVIDFGTSGIGDPACDVVLAWTLLSGDSRAAYRDTLALDDATWARGRGWGLWKALITVAGSRDTDVPAADEARRVLREILADPVH